MGVYTQFILILVLVGNSFSFAFARDIGQGENSGQKLARADYSEDNSQVAEPGLPDSVGTMVLPPDNLSVIKEGGEVRPLMVFTPFAHNSGEINEAGKQYLDEVVCPALRQKTLRGNFYELTGHTDSNGSAEKNMRLSRDRAIAIRNYLVHQCQFDPRKISVRFHGGNMPMVPNTTKRNRNLNNRVELRVLP